MTADAVGLPQVPSRLLLHVGYQKTATTWLQRIVFDSGRYGLVPWGVDGSEQGARILWNADPLDYDVEELRAQYLQRLRRDIAPTDWVALSSEGFVGALFSGGHNSGWNAGVLAELFPEARVLLVVREQRSMILSAYGQYVKKGGLLDLKGFVRGSRGMRMPFFNLRHFEYDRLVRVYFSRFGRDRVLVLPYELIGSDPRQFVQSLRAFLGLSGDIESPPSIRLNPALDAWALRLMRRTNYLRRADVLNGFSPLATRLGARIIDRICDALSSRRFAARNLAVRAAWQEQIEQHVGHRFAASNQRLATLTGLPLAALGYDLLDLGASPGSPADEGGQMDPVRPPQLSARA